MTEIKESNQTSNDKKSKTRKYLSMGALLLCAIIWGLGYSGVQDALDGGWSAYGILCFRGLVGGALCLLLSFREKWWKKGKKYWFGVVFSGVTLFLGYWLQTLGQERTTIANTGFFTALNLIMVPFFALLFFKEKLSIQSIVAPVLALIGVGIMSFDGGSFSLHIGDLYNFLGAVCFAIQIAYMTTLSNENAPFSIAGFELLIMGVLGGIFVLCMPNTVHFGSGGWIGALYVAIVSSGISFFLQVVAQKYVNSSTSAVLLGQECLFATLFSLIIYKSTISWQTIVGGLIIFISALISSFDFKTLKFKKNNKIEEDNNKKEE